MKSAFRIGLCVAAFAGVCCAPAKAQLTAPVHVFDRVELKFTARHNFANPYTDVEMWVDLKGPNFSKRCYGFWDGGQTFRVRITSTTPGNWTWTSGSNPPDPGLAGRKGSLTSIAWTEAEKQQNPNRRGIPQATPNGHALEYPDGTPYFAVGDFFYPASTSRYRWRDSDEKFDVSDPEAGYKDLLNYRIKQGFNMIFIISCFPSWAYDGRPAKFKDRAGVPMRDAWPNGNENRAENMVNEENERPFFFPGKGEGYPEVGPDFFRINPSYFRYLDKKMDYAADHGVVVLLETLRRDIAPYMKAYYGGTNPDMSKNAVFYYLRWIFARYQAHPVVWSIYHYDCLCAPYGLEPNELRVPLDGFHKKYGQPPFGQLVSTNVSGSTYRAWGHTDKAPWLTMHFTGNNPRDHSIGDYVLEMYNLPKPIPIYGQEPWYLPNDSEEERRKSRSTMYSQLMNGGLAGVAYQAMGLTRGNREDSKQFVNMWVSITWQAANEVPLTEKFLTEGGVRVQDLVPHRELLSVSKTGTDAKFVHFSDTTKILQEGWSYCMRTEDKRHFKMYFERDAIRPDLSGAVPGGKYQAQWFNPRTGGWTPAGDGTLTATPQGLVALPDVPTSTDDWALSLVLK
jgi:hypothetical protein